MTSKKIRCLFCGEPYDFISGKHLNRHFGDHKDSFEAFKDWVAESHDIDRDHEVFHTAGALTRPDTHEKYKQLFKKEGEQ